MLAQLVHLDLNDNQQLTGACPKKSFGCDWYTTECFAVENALAGAIPTEIGQLTRLETLWLFNNS